MNYLSDRLKNIIRMRIATGINQKVDIGIRLTKYSPESALIINNVTHFVQEEMMRVIRKEVSV